MSLAGSSERSVAARGVNHRRPAAVVLVLLMLIAALPLVTPSYSADPGTRDNGDMTRSVLWNFTDASDYYLYNASISGGLGKLFSTNETTGENSTAQYLLGTRANIDVQAVPDSMMIDNASLPMHSVTIQPLPEDAYDNYIDEWFPSWSPADGSDLTISGQYDPDPLASKRQRIVMQFNLSTVPAGAVIKQAMLSLYEKPSRSDPLEYTIHPLTLTWAEYGVSWRTRNATEPWTYGGNFASEAFSSGTVDGNLGWHAFDLTRLVDLWVRNVTPNLGFIMVAKPWPTDNSKNFCDGEANKADQRPRLVIDYTLGEAVGTYESAALGPGANSTFTLAAWSSGTTSKATDEFSGSSLATKWDWTLDPSLLGGSVDFSPPGWLNITGSQPTYLPNASVECNFLYQNIMGNFTAETSLQTYFTASGMGAGLMLMNDAITWLSIYKTGIPGEESIVAEVSKGGTRVSLGQTLWSGSAAFLRMERDGASYLLQASTDGSSWTTVGSYAATYDFRLEVSLGPFVFSGGSALQPSVAFDYVRILSAEQPTTIYVSARTGNSTMLTDPSWGSWSAPLSPNTGAVFGSAGRYIQYRVTMRTSCDWHSPVLTGFECHYERFAENGTIKTGEMAPPSFLIWETITVTQTLAAGDIEYFYSTNHGSSWTSLGSGNSFPLYVSISTLMIRAELSTRDTASSPSINTIELVYRITHAWFYVSAPATVEAGQSFVVYIEPKDTSNDTAAWTGAVALHAVDSSGLLDASSELAVTQAVVPAGGQLTVSGESYEIAETIRVLVSGGGASGLSQSITVIPGPATSILVEPNVTRLPQNTSTEFTASLRDEFGNNITGASFTWLADPGLGSLDVTTGSTVNLTTVEAESSGYLTVTCGSLTELMFIFVSASTMPPDIDPNIPAQIRHEDFGSWSLDLTPYISDREDNLTDLRWYTLNETYVTVSGENRTGDMFMTLTTIQDIFGVNLLQLWVVDSDRMSSMVTITVEITPVNDPPRIDPIDPIVVRYDDPYQYNVGYYVRDAEAPPQILILSVDAKSVPYVHISNLWLTFLYPAQLNGTQQTVFLTVSDGEYMASTVILVTISDDQVPRALGTLPDQTMYQGDIRRGVLDLDDYFTDPDGTTLFYTNGNTHVGVIIQPNHTVDFYAPNDWAGQEYIVFIAEDDSEARAESPLRMTVLAVNQPPTISNVPDLVIRCGVQYNFDLGPYIQDADDEIGELTLTASDPHTWTFAALLSMSFPSSMVGLKVPVNITVSDGLLSDWWIINVTISNDYPPVLAMAASDHSFLEDNPLSYPVIGYLEDFFTDIDGDPLTYSAFVSSRNITVTVVAAGGHWSIEFAPEDNWHGLTNLTFRATDGQGALVETTVLLTVLSVPDSPVLSLPDSFAVTQGSRSLLDLSGSVTDPDSVFSDFRWTLGSDYPDFISIHGGIVVFDFPLEFLEEDEASREITVAVSVSDQDSLVSSDEISITVQRNVVVTDQNPLLWIGLLASIVAVACLSVYAVVRRRKPFVVHDLMLIHKDGFLIGRYASRTKGEIDEDVLSGMLTAVLNFVEDSTASEHGALTSFGFKDYNVLAERGNRVFAAVVFEGDTPKETRRSLKEFLSTVEKVYNKKLQNWSGDIDNDFAGIEVLIRAWVKENSKKGRKTSEGIWKMGPSRPKVTPRKVTVNNITRQKIEPESAPSQEPPK